MSALTHNGKRTQHPHARYAPAMLHGALRWLLPLVALLVFGPVAWMLTGHLRGPDGSDHASLLLSTTPLKGITLGVLALVLAGGVGLITARLIGASYGLFATGLVLAWAAWGTGDIDAIARAQSAYAGGAPSATSFFLRLSLEAAILLPLAVAIAITIFYYARESAHTADPHPFRPFANRFQPTLWLQERAAIGLAAACVAGAVVAWLIAQESNKGQTFAAAAFAGLLGAVAGRLGANRASGAVFIAAPALLAVIGPILALLMGGGTLHTATSGTLFNLARPLPLDWLAGAFVGVPIGLSWAASMIDQHHAAQPNSTHRIHAAE